MFLKKALGPDQVRAQGGSAQKQFADIFLFQQLPGKRQGCLFVDLMSKGIAKLQHIARDVNHHGSTDRSAAAEATLGQVLAMCTKKELEESVFLARLEGCNVGRNAHGHCFHVSPSAQRLRVAIETGSLHSALPGVLGQLALQTCCASLAWFSDLVHRLSDIIDSHAPGLSARIEDLQPHRGKQRALKIDPKWSEAVALTVVQDGRARSAIEFGRSVGGSSRRRTFGGAVKFLMGRYAWNLARTFNGQSQLSVTVDASWGSGQDWLSAGCHSWRLKISGWAPPQVIIICIKQFGIRWMVDL